MINCCVQEVMPALQEAALVRRSSPIDLNIVKRNVLKGTKSVSYRRRGINSQESQRGSVKRVQSFM
jgi:hypothetical protein